MCIFDVINVTKMRKNKNASASVMCAAHELCDLFISQMCARAVNKIHSQQRIKIKMIAISSISFLFLFLFSFLFLLFLLFSFIFFYCVVTLGFCGNVIFFSPRFHIPHMLILTLTVIRN